MIDKKSFASKLKNNNDYLKSLAVLTSGSLVGSIIIAVEEILQTHIFSAESIGIYTYLLAIPLMFMGVVSFRYDISIVVEEDDDKALSLVKLSFILAFISSLIISLLYYFYILFFKEEYHSYLFLIPFSFVMLFGYGVNNTLNSYNNRCQDYKLISSAYVIRTTCQRLTIVLFGLLFVIILNKNTYSVAIMTICYCVGVWGGNYRQWKALKHNINKLRTISFPEIKRMSYKYRRQALFSTPALFINGFSFSIITIIIEWLFNPTMLAYYSVSDRVLGMPIALISANIAKVFLEDASKEYNRTGLFWNAFKKNVVFLSALAIPLFFVLFFFSTPICEVVFGSGWGEAGKYIRILAIMFSFRLIGTSISQALSICDKQQFELVYNIALALSSLVSGFITWKMHGSIYIFLMLLCVLKSICYIALIIYIGYCSTHNNTVKERNNND